MDKPVNISDIWEAMQIQSEEMTHYVDRATGRVESITDEDMRCAEDEKCAEDAPQWQQESIELAKALNEDTSGRFVALPDRFEIDEYDMMREFAEREAGGEASNALLNAIGGRGAFRRFKDQAARLDLLDRWYKWRDAHYRAVAIEWCERNGIEWTEEEPATQPRDKG